MNIHEYQAKELLAALWGAGAGWVRGLDRG